jgi:two-component system chemotaxis sensor kinase CheA
MDDLLSDFVVEAAEALAGLQAGLASLMLRRGDVDAVPDMLRRLHGLKGLCGFVGLPQAEAVAHAAEGLLAVAAQAPEVPDTVTLRMIAEMIGRLGQLIGAATLRQIDDQASDPDLIGALDVIVADMQPKSDRRGRAPWCGLDTLARGLGDRLGKRIDLVVGGDDVRIALSAAPAVRTALIALVRNACDHGVEEPEARRALGKPSRAMLHVTVRRTGDGVAIDVSDDGRGVDTGKVRERFAALGRAHAEGAAALSDTEVQNLIFAPGLSTAETLTLLSGRGLGLELVRREVESLGGGVQMSSTKGLGCRFTLELPKSVLAAPGARRLVAA